MPRPASKSYRVGDVLLRRRPHGRSWMVVYNTPEGRKEYSLGIRDLKMAMKKAREIDAELARGEFANLAERRRAGRVLLKDFIPEAERDHLRWNDETKRSFSSILKRISAALGAQPLDSVSSAMVQRFLADIAGEGRKPSTVNRYRSVFSSLFKAAKDLGLATYNPVEQVKFRKEAQKIPDALPQDQMDRLLAELPPHARFVVLLLFNTGMRLGEARNLQWEDIDFDHRQIRVRRSGRSVEFRVIPMTDQLFQLLREKQNDDYGPHVVTGPSGKPIQNIRTALNNAATRAGLPHVTHHQFRHTFATRIRELGAPIVEIKELLGHKTMAMTLRYAKATPTQLVGAIARLSTYQSERDSTPASGNDQQDTPDPSAEAVASQHS